MGEILTKVNGSDIQLVDAEFVGGPADGETYILHIADTYYFCEFSKRMDGKDYPCSYMAHELPDIKSVVGKVYRYDGVLPTSLQTDKGSVLCNYQGCMN